MTENNLERISSLCLAIEIKAELLSIEEELKQISVLIRNLPRKKKKLSGRQVELLTKYNQIIETEKLPLRKFI